MLLVSALAALAYFMRCLHLFDPGHYFVLRADSHFFHWVARGILAGEPPPSAPWANDVYTLQSGLAYPLAWVGRAVSSVFGVPPAEALDLASKFLPPFIAMVTRFGPSSR